MRLPAATAIALEPTSATPHARIEKAAHELEAQFAQMLIKSMRSASPGDPLMGGDNTYRDMYDQQLSRELTKGRGLGLAPMIMRQLERSSGTAAKPAATSYALPPNSLPLGAPGVAAPMPLAPSSSGVSMPALTPAEAPAAPAVDAMSDCAPDGPVDCSSPEAFVRSIWPHAQKTAAELGVPAKALVAQAALETGWGRRLAGQDGASSHNLFGIKAGGRWNGQRMSANTHEYVDGTRRSERADFRAYTSPADSFADYARVLGNPRYASARGAGDDVHRFASALQQAGYATDPSYAAKISAIADGATLNRALATMPGADSMNRYAAATVDMPSGSTLSSKG
ncbi:flagellar assembly peptidoglycan hydrolase FlgJ [Lysobacter sp. TAF61]|uniref:flagellar assembly peptidoglycan hydrolase FlgJ n=1 Tax=Lysobacter sp. TAF61 TaxID=3233072 RepID=UPI003F99051E